MILGLGRVPNLGALMFHVFTLGLCLAVMFTVTGLGAAGFLGSVARLVLKIGSVESRAANRVKSWLINRVKNRATSSPKNRLPQTKV
jgi:hypothetical protein